MGLPLVSLVWAVTVFVSQGAELVFTAVTEEGLSAETLLMCTMVGSSTAGALARGR
jgi:hypothetical protein